MDILTMIDRITVDSDYSADLRRVIGAEAQIIRVRRAAADQTACEARRARAEVARYPRASHAPELRRAAAAADERAADARAHVAQAEAEARRVMALWGVS